MSYLKKRQERSTQNQFDVQEKVGIFEHDKLDPVQAECNDI